MLAQCTALTHLDLRGWRGSGYYPYIAKMLAESWIGPEGGLKVDGLDSEEWDDDDDWEDEEELMSEVFSDGEGVYYKRYGVS